MGRGGDDIGARKRRRMNSAGYQSGDMRNVRHQIRSRRVRDFSEFFKINLARVSRRPRDNKKGLFLFSDFHNFPVIQPLRFPVNSVRNLFPKLSGN